MTCYHSLIQGPKNVRSMGSGIISFVASVVMLKGRVLILP